MSKPTYITMGNMFQAAEELSTGRVIPINDSGGDPAIFTSSQGAKSYARSRIKNLPIEQRKAWRQVGIVTFMILASIVMTDTWVRFFQ